MSLFPLASDPGGQTQRTYQTMFHRVFRADPVAVRGVLADIRHRFRNDVCADTLGRLELVLAEVMNNVAEHGPQPRVARPKENTPAATAANDAPATTLDAGPAKTPDGTADGTPAMRRRPPTPAIHLCIVRHVNGLACAVTDDGVSLPDHCLLPRALPEIGDEGLPEGGFGWFLIQDLTQALCYYREERRNFLAFSVPFAGQNAESDSVTAE